MIHVSLAPDDPTTSYTYGPPLPELRLQCRRYRWSVFGGPVSAEVRVSGPEHALWTTLEWLRRPITLRNGAGQPVWWGYIQEIELQIGKRVVGRSLDKMANKVRIAYARRTPDTGLERETSTAIEDAASIARYGTKEVLYSMGDSTPSRAEAKAAELLASSKEPLPLQTFGGDAGDLTATFHCVGWIETLKWRYYERTGSQVKLEGKSSSSLQAIGWYLESTDVLFSRNAGGITDLQARLSALATGNKLQVTGSAYAGNNITYTVTRPTTDKRVVYTASTIFFASDDDIYDDAKGFAFVRNNALIRFSGTAQNGGVREIDGVNGEGYITTSHLAGQIAPEGVGPTITMEQGHEVGVSPLPANSLSTATTKTIVLYGYRMAQSFVSTFAGEVGQIGIVAGKTGAPTDSLRISLCADNDDEPGTVLGSATVAGSDLMLEPEWTWFEFTARPTVTSGATYWLLVERTGSNSPTDYYSIATTTTEPETESGACLAYTGAAWVTNPTQTFVPHQVWLAEETTNQVRQIAATVGQFIASTTIENASSIWDNPECDGDRTGYDEIEKLLDAGQAGGGRLLMTIDQNRVMRVYAKPTKPGETGAPDMYSMSGHVLIASGSQRRAEGDLPVGEWLAIERTPRHLGLSPVFVDAAEYDVERGTITIQPEGSR